MSKNKDKESIWGYDRPPYAGWYCALDKVYIAIQKEHVKEGGTKRPLGDYKEIVYLDCKAKVWRMGFVHEPPAPGKKRDWSYPKPTWSSEDSDYWCAFERIDVHTWAKVKYPKKKSNKKK